MKIKAFYKPHNPARLAGTLAMAGRDFSLEPPTKKIIL
jgi:hypothetical protein